MDFQELPEFEKDLKKLLKKFRSLDDDLETLKKVLSVQPEAEPPLSFRLTGYNEQNYLVKIKKVTCKSLKGRGSNTGLRVIYEYRKDIQKIIFIEIYFKADSELEDKVRLKRHYK